MPRARGMAAYVRDGYGAFRQSNFECGCCEMLVFRVCGVDRTFMCTIFIATIIIIIIIIIIINNNHDQMSGYLIVY